MFEDPENFLEDEPKLLREISDNLSELSVKSQDFVEANMRKLNNTTINILYQKIMKILRNRKTQGRELDNDIKNAYRYLIQDIKSLHDSHKVFSQV